MHFLFHMHTCYYFRVQKLQIRDHLECKYARTKTKGGLYVLSNAFLLPTSHHITFIFNRHKIISLLRLQTVKVEVLKREEKHILN